MTGSYDIYSLSMVIMVCIMVAFVIFYFNCFKNVKTQTGTGNIHGPANTRTGNRTRTGIRATNGNRTIRNFEELNSWSDRIKYFNNMQQLPRVTIPSDSNRRAVFERPQPSTQFLNEIQHNLILSSYAHTRTNNAIPTISRPAFDNFSLQRQTSLPSYDQVIRQQKTEESAPPRYDEIVMNLSTHL